MHDAGLHGRLGKGGIDGVRKTLQAIDNSDQDILDTPVPQLDTRKNLPLLLDAAKIE